MGRFSGIRWAVILGSFILVLSTAEADPKALCQAQRLPHGRALIDISVQDLIDPELARLIQLGLGGKVRVEIILWQGRPFWFDKNLYSDSRNLNLTWSPSDEVLILGDTPIGNREFINLDPVSLRISEDVSARASLYFEVSLHLEVVTMDSLTKLAHWMVGREEKEKNRAIVPTTILQAIAHDLSRDVRTHCTIGP